MKAITKVLNINYTDVLQGHFRWIQLMPITVQSVRFSWQILPLVTPPIKETPASQPATNKTTNPPRLPQTFPNRHHILRSAFRRQETQHVSKSIHIYHIIDGIIDPEIEIRYIG